MADFQTLIATLCYQKLIDNNGQGNGEHEFFLPYGITIKEYHILALIGAEYITMADIYFAMKYLRIFLTYKAIAKYVQKLKGKGLIRITQGKGKAYNNVFCTPTLEGYALLNRIQSDLLQFTKKKFNPAGAPGIHWKQKSLKHLQFNANGNEVDQHGNIKGEIKTETRGRKKKEQPNDPTS